MASGDNDYILQARHIDMFFPGVKALKDVTFNLKKGEIHSLMGENGAGKSTLIKVITGVYHKTAGEITYDGNVINPQSPLESQKLGISTVYQEVNLCANLTVAENIYIGREPRGAFGRIDWATMSKNATKLLHESLGIDIDVNKELNFYPVAMQQMIAIARAIDTKCKILILDEPTAALTNKEVRALFSTIARLKEQGISMIYISHRMEEIFELADRVTVIRDGEYVNTAKINEVNEAKLISWMVGREMSNIYPKEEIPLGDVIFEAKNISKKGLLDNISFSLRKNEILGVAGLAGAGRTELAECICGNT